VILGLAGDDQGRTGLVDQDRVHLVDDGVVEAALHALARLIHHVVAQVIKTELVIGAVGDVCLVRSLLRVMGHLRQVAADTQPEKTVDAPHPVRVTAGQVVIDGDHMNALTGERVQVDRQGGGEGLAFTGAHFGNLARVQHHAAHQLHVEVAHPVHPLAGFANHGKSFGQQGIEALALGDTLTEFVRLAAQLLIGQGLNLRLECVDGTHRLGVLANQPVIAAAENFLEKACDHLISKGKRGKTRILSWHPDATVTEHRVPLILVRPGVSPYDGDDFVISKP
jgi:hypothetical protein